MPMQMRPSLLSQPKSWLHGALQPKGQYCILVDPIRSTLLSFLQCSMPDCVPLKILRELLVHA